MLEMVFLSRPRNRFGVSQDHLENKRVRHLPRKGTGMAVISAIEALAARPAAVGLFMPLHNRPRLRRSPRSVVGR